MNYDQRTSDTLPLEVRQQIQREMNRARLWIRIFEGFKQLKIKPLKIVPFSLFLMVLGWLFYIVFSNRTIPILDNIIDPELFHIYDGIKIAIILLVALMLTALSAYPLGIPRLGWQSARKIENSLMMKFSSSKIRAVYCPILVSCRRVNKAPLFRMEFFSPYISLVMWKAVQEREDIPASWGYHIEGEITNGGKDNNDTRRITLHVAPGVRSTPRKAPSDPMFK